MSIAHERQLKQYEEATAEVGRKLAHALFEQIRNHGDSLIVVGQLQPRDHEGRAIPNTGVAVVMAAGIWADVLHNMVLNISDHETPIEEGSVQVEDGPEISG